MEPSLRIQEVDGLELVQTFSEAMETMLLRKVEAVKVLPVPPTCHTEVVLHPAPTVSFLAAWASALHPC